MRACVVNYNITFRLIEADYRSEVRFGTERTFPTARMLGLTVSSTVSSKLLTAADEVIE